MNLSKLSVVRIASWVGLTLLLGAQLVYGEFFCHYSFLASSTLMVFLSIPATIWLVRKRYLASLAASVGMLFWVVWENHIQCVSEEGPFVGGLGPIYLLVFGLSTSLALGAIFGWLDRRYLESAGPESN
jgi:hypothetical protein